jgi:hypothetical protein
MGIPKAEPVRPMRTANGSEVRNSLGSGWQLAHRPEGWLILSRPSPSSPDLHPLARHADWAGPFKLVQSHGEVEQRVEFFLGHRGGEEESTLDDEAAQAAEALRQELLAFAMSGERRGTVSGWVPPTASALAGWLAQAGRESARDAEENLRLTLKRPGCDGQVRIERGEGRLRFLLPLGHWPGLDPLRAKAMRTLAGLVNANVRLARVAWLTGGAACRCEAQVDLSGLPLPGPDSHVREVLWARSVGVAVRALELVLRQLGLELPVLADDRHGDLAERLTAAPAL